MSSGFRNMVPVSFADTLNVTANFRFMFHNTVASLYFGWELSPNAPAWHVTKILLHEHYITLMDFEKPFQDSGFRRVTCGELLPSLKIAPFSRIELRNVFNGSEFITNPTRVQAFQEY